VNDQFISVVEQQRDDLQEIARTIRPQPQLTAWALLIIVRQRVGDQVPLRAWIASSSATPCLRAERWTSTEQS